MGTTYWTYDVMGRPICRHDPRGTVVYYAYDASSGSSIHRVYHEAKEQEDGMAAHLGKVLLRAAVLVSLAALIWFICSVLILMRVGAGSQIRLDCGDGRYTFFGIPYKWRRMHERARSQLLMVAQQEPVIAAQWAALPRPTSERDYLNGAQHMYSSAAPWVEVDPHIARLIVRDLAEWITEGSGRNMEALGMLGRPVIESGVQGYKVTENWREHWEVRSYLEKRGYSIDR